MRIEWNKTGERRFEAGLDRGVLYPRNAPGVAWNGLVSVAENTVGGDLEPLYFNGVKYLDAFSSEDFQAVIEAFSAPPEFAACEGVKQLAPGLSVSQQPRAMFDFSYRTLIGNDILGTDLGYKLHLVYNCTAAASGRTNQTLGGRTDPGTRTWTVNTVPPPATNFKPTAHVVIDSTQMDPYLLEEIETVLYGRDASGSSVSAPAYLPTVAELIAIMGNDITETIEATI